MAISVVINTLNEEANIERAIKSVKSIADEIIVVDMESEDKTVSIAENLGAIVFSHKKTNYVEPARNFAISKARNEWILILDADEKIPKTLAAKLQDISKDDINYWRLPRRNMIFGKWMRKSRWWPDYNIRFFRAGSVTWQNEVHSIPVTYGKGMDLEARKEYAIVHYHYDSVEQYVTRLNRYTTIQAAELMKKGYKFKRRDLIEKPIGEFLSRYFAGQGYKDGIHGLAIALLQGCSEVVLYTKLWQMQGFKAMSVNPKDLSRIISSSMREVNYWKANMLLEHTGNLFYRVKRKLRI